MATLAEISKRVLTRFRDVPGVTPEDAEAWVELGMNEHGFSRTSNVPDEYIPIIMLYAEADGAFQISMRVAHYFKYGDRDESVDKTKVADNYRKLADSLWERYKLKRSEGVGDIGGSAFHIMSRADRL